MYLAFYGLRETPFSPTPDPKFLFQSARHREALARLLDGVREGRGFLVLTGEIGTGKTTLLRTLLERLDASTPVAYVHNSSLGIEGLLEYVLKDWGVRSTATSHATRLVELNEFLIAQHRDGLAPVLVIDEAQNLDVPTLQAVLSSLETASHTPVQILLVGQPELRHTLEAPALRPLERRIGVRCHIAPLASEETRLYIRHRLRVAGAADAGIFTDAAIAAIAQYSRGIPRVINTVCDHCLVTGYAERKRRVEASTVKEAIEGLEDAGPGTWKPSGALVPAGGSTAMWAARSTVAVLIVVLVALLMFAANAMGWLSPLPR